MTTFDKRSIISVTSQKTPPMTTPFLPVQQLQSLPKHPLFGLWNPIYQGYLVNDVKEVHADSSIWTKEFTEAHKFRTEEAALTAGKHLRDFYGVHVIICVMEFNNG